MALIVVGDRIKNTKRNSVGVDEFYGPYEADETTNRSALQVAEDTLTSAHKMVPGQTVGIKSPDGGVKDYQVQPKGTTPETYGLVEKGAGTTDYNDLENKPTIGDGTNTNLPIAGNIKVSASTASGSTPGVAVTLGQNPNEIQMQFTLPKGDKGDDGADGQDGQDGAPGADAVNPFKGYYPSGISKPATGAVGDYIYAPPSDPQSNATATIWHYDNTQTPPWTDTSIDVSNIVAVEFGSGQSVSATKIKDENGEDVTGPADVLSAEAGKALKNKIEDPEPIEFQATNYGLLNWNTGQSYGTSTDSRYSDMFATRDFKYIHYKTYISDSGAALAFYDENQNYLQSISIRGTSQLVESTIDLTDSTYSTVRYVRLGAYRTLDAFARLYSDGSLTDRVSNLETNVGVIEEKTDGIKQKVIETTTADTISGGYINPSYGTIYSTSSGIYTELMSTNNYTNVYYKTSITSSGAALAFYDENQQYLRSISIIGSGPVENTIDLTDSTYSAVRYVRASGYNNTPILTLYNTTSLNYKFDKLSSESIYLPSDLKVLIFGDSITDSMSLGIDFTTNTSTTSNWHTNSYTKDGNTIVYKIWPQLLAEYLGSKDIRCYAKSGAKYVDWATQGGNDNQRQKLSYQIEVALNDLDNSTAFPHTQGTYKPDVIIFALGTNDGAPNDTLESALNKTVWIDNSSSEHVSVDIDATLNNLDRTKFFEAARYAFLKMKSLYPDALFLCILPIQRWSSNTPNMTTLHDGLKSICNYYSIPVIDGAFEMGITRDLEVYSGIGKLLKDGLHPNEIGQNVYARFVISNILSRYIEYNGMNIG